MKIDLSIKLKLEGFEELIKAIEDAGGKANDACKTAMDKSATIMQNELKTQMQSSGVESDLINAMPPPTVTQEGNTFYAKVGYDKGAYDPKNLSDAYKVVFLNYGTPHRSKHGKVAARGFIPKAKNKATKKIKAEQENTLNEILKGLKGE